MAFLKGTTTAFPRWACLVCRAAPFNVLAASDFCIVKGRNGPIQMQLRVVVETEVSLTKYPLSYRIIVPGLLPNLANGPVTPCPSSTQGRDPMPATLV